MGMSVWSNGAGPAAPGRRSSQRRARPAPLPVGAAPTPRHAPASHPNRPGPQLQPDHGPPCRSPIDPHPPRPTRGHSVPRFGGGGHGRAWTALVDAVHLGGGVGFGGRGRSGRRGCGMLRRVGRRWPVPCAWQKMAASLPRRGWRAWGACPSLACIGRGAGRADGRCLAWEDAGHAAALRGSWRRLHVAPCTCRWPSSAPPARQGRARPLDGRAGPGKPIRDGAAFDRPASPPLIAATRMLPPPFSAASGRRHRARRGQPSSCGRSRNERAPDGAGGQ